MTTVNYSGIRDLQLFDRDDLLDDEVVLNYQTVLNAIVSPETSLTIDEVVTSLINDSFYLPKLIAVNDTLGFIINGVFRQINYNFSDGEKLASAEKKPGDPDRYLLRCVVGEITFEIAISVPEKVKTLELLKIVSDYQDNSANTKAFIKLLIPEAVTVISDGVYEVNSVQKFDKYANLTLKNGILLRTNSTVKENLSEVTVIAGFIYCSKEGKPYQGVSLTGKADNLLAVSTPEIGDIFNVKGVSSNDTGKGVYHVIKVTDSQNVTRVINGEGSIALKAVKNLSRGASTNIKLTGVKKQTGNMNSDKPIWSIA